MRCCSGMERHSGDRRHFRGNGDSRRSQRNSTNPKRQQRLPRSPAVTAVTSIMLRARILSTEVDGRRWDSIRSLLTAVCRAIRVFVILSSVSFRSPAQIRGVEGGGGGHVLAAELRHACQEAGSAWSTLHRARSRRGAGTQREGFGAGSKYYWHLRDATENGSIASMDVTPAPSN